MGMLLAYVRRLKKTLSTPATNEIYVNSATGDNSHAGTLAAPMQTFAAAMAAAAGQADQSATFTIHLQGTFAEACTFSRGNVQVAPYGAGAVVNGAGTRKGFDFGGFNNCGVAGIEITACTYAVYASGGTGPSVLNCTIHDNQRGVYLTGVGGYQVFSNIVTNTTAGEGISIWNAISAGDVAHNECSGCRARGIYGSAAPDIRIYDNFVHDGPNWQTASDYGIEVEGVWDAVHSRFNGSDRAIIINNWVTHCNNGVIAKTSDSVIVAGNVCWSNFNYGVYLKGATNSTASYNDCHANGNNGSGIAGANIGVLQDDRGTVTTDDDVGSTGNEISFNVSSNAVGYSVRTDTLSTGNTYHDNDHYNNAGFARNTSTIYTTLAAWQGDYGDANSTELDPAYNSTTYGGFVSGTLSDKGHGASTFSL
jgi:parallel beta-helix repeat protein